MKQELFNNKTKAEDYQRQPKQLGLYEASHEHDACGVGMLVNIQGGKSHELVESALKVLENMRHRGAEGADNRAFPFPRKGNTAPACFSFPKTEKTRLSS